MTPDLTVLYAASGGMTSGPIRENGRTIGSAVQRGERIFFLNNAGQTLGYMVRDSAGRTTLFRPDGSTAARFGR